MELNEKQNEAVKHMGSPLLIVAGAGSGKTKTLTSRLIYLLEQGIDPRNIIAITFTNKAAQEMKDRIMNKELGTMDETSLLRKAVFIGTFHSLGVRILKREARLIDRNFNFTIFDGDDSKSLIKKIITGHNFTEKEKKRITVPFLMREFSKIKNELLDIDEVGDETVAEFFKEYEKALQKNNALDFDDLLEKVVRIFQKYPQTLEKYQNQFKYILVDEYQDTNTSQYYLIKLLAQKHKNLSVVGDDQQSIFKFRGSDFRNFLNFEQDWHDVKVVLLEENYRSTGNIIDAASAIISNNKFQKSKTLWTRNPKGSFVKLAEHFDAEAEAEWIAEKISNNFRHQTPGEEKTIGILYRTNAQSRAIEQSLIERGISYQIFGGMRFYERKEIKDIVAGMRYASNPDDSISLERLNKNFLKAQYLELKGQLPQKAKELKPMELISYIISATKYFDGLKKNYSNYTERIENVNELIGFASQFESLEEFLEKILLLQPLDNKEKEDKKTHRRQGKGVNLMTIHLSKGLEFDEVYVVGTNEGLLPHQMSLHNDMEIEEERRLMYVAMTRAKKELFLNFYHIPSRFLGEIPSGLLEFAGEVRDERSLDDEDRYIEY